jgi:hypothetical protein
VRSFVAVGTCLAILFLAYVLLSGAVTNKVADASGARRTSSFNALWFAYPSVASRSVRAGTPLHVVIANQTHGAQTLQWSTSSAGSKLERGSIRVPRSSTATFVVQTADARPGHWFTVRLDGTSLAIKALITS